MDAKDRAMMAIHKKGETAGFASRFVAFIVDMLILIGVFYLALGLYSLVWGPINLEQPHIPSIDAAAFAIAFGVWTYLYWLVSWAVFGKSAGKALFGLRVVKRHDGASIGWGRAALRVIGYLISLVCLFMGFVWIAISRKRSGWHDYIARTKVVYDWKAREADIWMAGMRKQQFDDEARSLAAAAHEPPES